MNGKRILLLAAVAGVGALGAYLRAQLGEVEVATGQAWPAGAAATYRMTWQSDSELALDGSNPLVAHVDLRASLRLVSHGKVDGATLLEASFSAVGNHRIEVLGREVFDSDAAAQAALVGPVAWVRLTGDGAIDHVYFAHDAPPAFAHAMQSVIGLAIVAPRAQTEWTASEPGPSGIAAVTYHRDGAALHRTRDHYEKLAVVPGGNTAKPELAATADIALDPSGRVATLVDDEQLAVGTQFEGHCHFTLTAETTGPFAVAPEPRLAELEARTPGEPSVSGDVDRGHLEQRVGTLTFDGLVAGVHRRWNDRDARRQWFSQAVALLQLDPALCRELVEQEFGAAGSDRTRMMAMDLLAAAGNADAQVAMRDALARPTAQAQQVMLVQRFSRVTTPTADTARFLLAQHPAERDLAIATAYTAGAVAQRIRTTNAALADQLEISLRDQLANARSDRERGELLGAIGNAGSAASLDTIRSYTAAADPDVRGHAAWAMRDIRTAEARDALYGLATDSDPSVAREALAALGHQPLGAPELDQLERSLAGHDLADATRSALVDLLANHMQDASPAVRRMLEAIDQSTTDRDLQARARVVLAELP